MRVAALWLLAVGIVSVGVAAPAWAQDVELEVRTAGVHAVPLGAVPFRQQGGAPAPQVGIALRSVLLDDLEFSGVFTVRDVLPPSDGKELETARRVGLQAVVRGEYRMAEDGLVWEVRLFDLAFDRQVAGKRYRGTPADARRMAHAFADDVVRAYTGKAGVAQTRLIFLADSGRTQELFLCDYDGHNVRQITSVRDLVVAPAWAPDGKQVFYTSYHRGNPDLYRATLATGDFERVANYKGLNTTPAVSPDGRELALTLSRDGNSEIYLMSLATKRLRRLTFGTAVDTQPAWAPNGQEIAFVSDREGRPQIYVMDRDGADVRRLTYGVGYTTSPSWSPRGDRIAFVSQQSGRLQLMTVTPQGSELHQLTAGAANCEDPSWSPDGRHLAYSRQLGNRAAEIWVVRADGSGARPVVVRGADCTAPAWSP